MSPIVFSIRSPLPTLHCQSSPSRGEQLPLVPHPHPICPHSPQLGVLLGKRVHLDENLPLELVWRGKAISRNIYWFGQEHVPKDLLEILRHVPLLSNAAVVLNGENDRETGRRKRAVRTSTLSGWNQRLLSSVSKPAFCTLKEQFASTTSVLSQAFSVTTPEQGVPTAAGSAQHGGGLANSWGLPKTLPTTIFSQRNPPLAGRHKDTLFPTKSHVCGLVLELWIKVGFTLLQLWLYPLFAFLAGPPAEVQVPAVLTRR